MLERIDEALISLLESELGYTVNPEDVQSYQAVSDDNFTVCILSYPEETPLDDSDETIGFWTQTLNVQLDLQVLNGESGYRKASFAELSRVKLFITNLRKLLETQHNICIMETDYSGFVPKSQGNKRSSGGIVINFELKYRQSKTDPTTWEGGPCGC